MPKRKAAARRPAPLPAMVPPMSAETYRAALRRFGLTQGEAGWLFGGKSRTSGRRWAAEGAPYAVAVILTMMREHDITPAEVEQYGARWRNK